MTSPGRASSILLGLLAAFVAAVDAVRAIRPDLLLDSDASWALPRLGLWLLVAFISAAAGGIAAALFFGWSRTVAATQPLSPLPFKRSTLAVLFVVAVLAAAIFRFVWLDRLPPALWEDDVSLIAPAIALQGSWRDLADPVRPVMYGAKAPYGSVGVLYLEAFRLVLGVGGITVFALRFVSAFSGVLSVLTCAWLARTLLPRGGGTLAAVILAGLRWHLILSRWGWNMVAIAPLLDLAAIAVIRSRRGRSAWPAAAAGLLVGLAAHVYLAAWIAGAALFAWLLWPRHQDDGKGGLAPPAAAYLGAFAAVVLPLFLLRPEGSVGYLRRVGHHNVLTEMRLSRSALPPFSAAADSVRAPWFLPDPVARQDLPGRSRLGWALGIAVAAGLARAFVNWREEASSYLLAQGGAALAASVAGGQAFLPNGARFGYLAGAAAIAAAAGVLWILSRVPVGWRRIAAILGVGVLGWVGLAGARDAILKWAPDPGTFASFYGQDTLIGRAAARWDRLGSVRVDHALGHSPDAAEVGTVELVRRFRLDPQDPGHGMMSGAPRARQRSFRVASPQTSPEAGERIVERVQDGWGKTWAVVLGRAGPA